MNRQSTVKECPSSIPEPPRACRIRVDLQSKIESNTQERLNEVKLTTLDDKLLQDIDSWEKKQCYTDEKTTMMYLIESTFRWHQLLIASEHVTETNRKKYDLAIISLSKIFFDTPNIYFLNKTSYFIREIFNAYMELLNTKEILNAFNDSSALTVIDLFCLSNANVLISILTKISQQCILNNEQSLQKYSDLFLKIRTYLDRYASTSSVKPATENVSTSFPLRLLEFIWNLTDLTSIVPFFLNLDFVPSILNWFSSSLLSTSEHDATISIIQNITRHDSGVDEFNKYDATRILKNWKEENNEQRAESSFIVTMSLAHLCNRDQIKADPIGTKVILDQLLDVTMKAASNPEFRENGFHVSEPLCVLVKLFVNDSDIDYVMNHAQTQPPSTATSTISLFAKLFVHFSSSISKNDALEKFTFIALCNIIWSISFHEIYHEDLQSHSAMIEIIKSVAQNDVGSTVGQYVPRSMLSMKKATDGILFNLKLETVKTPTDLRFSIALRKKPLVMISYCHANSNFCEQILTLLDARADLFDVWIDKRCCKGSSDVWEAIAQGIKNAQLVICIVSDEYITSKSCRQEIIYAKDRLNKQFLPVFIEKPVLSDWLDIRLAEFKYVRFQNTQLELNESKIREFISILYESILSNEERQTESLNQHMIPRDDRTTTDQTTRPSHPQTRIESQQDRTTICHWKEPEIHSWFENNGISAEIRDLYQFRTGGQMIIYADCIQNDQWLQQYERYAKRFHEKYPTKDFLEHEFALFVSALRQLSSEFYQNIQTDLQTMIKSRKQNDQRRDSQSCRIM